MELKIGGGLIFLMNSTLMTTGPDISTTKADRNWQVTGRYEIQHVSDAVIVEGIKETKGKLVIELTRELPPAKNGNPPIFDIEESNKIIQDFLDKIKATMALDASTK